MRLFANKDELADKTIDGVHITLGRQNVLLTFTDGTYTRLTIDRTTPPVPRLLFADLSLADAWAIPGGPFFAVEQSGIYSYAELTEYAEKRKSDEAAEQLAERRATYERLKAEFEPEVEDA
jgi:hypothetical protein